MPISKLTDLVEGHQDFTVHVYVSRLWQHRGASDDGPIKHTDIVFQDVEVLSFVVASFLLCLACYSSSTYLWLFAIFLFSSFVGKPHVW